MFRSFSAVAICVSVGFLCVQRTKAEDKPSPVTGHTHAQDVAFVKKLSAIVNDQGTAPAKPQTPIQMGPLVVIGNRPTKKQSVGAGVDFKSADAGSANAPTFPSQAETDAFVKKISALVGQHGSSQAKPQTPIQMEPLVVIGNRPPKSPSAGIEGSDIGSGGLTENAGSDAPDAAKPQTPQPTPGSKPVNPTTTILNPPPPTAQATFRFAEPVLVDKYESVETEIVSLSLTPPIFNTGDTAIGEVAGFSSFDALRAANGIGPLPGESEMPRGFAPQGQKPQAIALLVPAVQKVRDTTPPKNQSNHILMGPLVVTGNRPAKNQSYLLKAPNAFKVGGSFKLQQLAPRPAFKPAAVRMPASATRIAR